MSVILRPKDFADRVAAGETLEAIFGTIGAPKAKLVTPQAEISANAGDDRSFDFVISTEAVDRYTDTVKLGGWQTKNFAKSPVVLWAHDDTIPAIGRASNTRTTKGELKSTVTFADAGTHPLADTVCALVQQKILRAASVGFIPLKTKASNEPGRQFGLDILEQDLLEWSVVNIPANPECLIQAKGMGIDTGPLAEWAERILDGDARLPIPRAELEALRRSTDARGLSYHFIPREFTMPSLHRKTEAGRRAVAEGMARDVLPFTPRREDAGGFKSLGEFLVAVRDVTVEHRTDRRLVRAPHGAGEVDPTGGGFLVPEIYSTSLIESIYQESQLWPHCSTDVRDGPIAGVRVPGVDETSRADGSRFGGALSYWAAEADQVIATKPRFRMIDYSAHKLIALVYASNELIADSAIFNAYVRRALVAEASFKLDAAIVSGSGAGLPMGMLNSPALITVAKDIGQGVASISTPNLTGMWKRLPSPSRKNAVWLCHEDVTDQLDGLAALGQLNAALYSPPGTNGSPYALLKGRPVIEVEQCQVVGTPGDIILADLRQYLVIMNAPRLALSADFKFDTDESVFRFALRVDGKSLFSSAITPFAGSTTRSPFVAIQAR